MNEPKNHGKFLLILQNDKLGNEKYVQFDNFQKVFTFDYSRT